MGSTNSIFEEEFENILRGVNVLLEPATRIASSRPGPGDPASYIDLLGKQNGEPYNKVPERRHYTYIYFVPDSTIDLVQVEQKLAELISNFQTLEWAKVRTELVRLFSGVVWAYEKEPTNDSFRFALDRASWIYCMLERTHPNRSVLEGLRLCERLVRLGRTDPQAIPPMEVVD